MFLTFNTEWIIRREKEKYILYNHLFSKMRLSVNRMCIELISLCDGTRTENEIIEVLAQRHKCSVYKADECVRDFLDKAILAGIIQKKEKEKIDIYIYGSKRLYVPYIISVEITKMCPLKCSHCYAEAGKGEQLSLNDLESILQQASDMGIAELQLTGGEIFTYPSVIEIINKWAKRFAFIQLNTSGYLLTESDINSLDRNKNVLWNISLDGNQEVHNQIRGVADAYQKAVSAIRMLSTSRMRTTAVLTLSSKNIMMIDQVVEDAFACGCDALIYGFVLPIGRAKKDDILSTEQIVNVNSKMKKIAQDWSEKGFIVSAKEECNDICHVKNCGLGHSTVAILSNGDIKPCLSVDIKMGNIKENCLEEVLIGAYSEFFSKKNPPNKEECGECRLYPECCGCIAHALAVSEGCKYVNDFLVEIGNVR